MPPCPIQSVVDFAFLRLLARGTWKLGSLDEVDPEIKPPLFLGKLDVANLPGVGEPKGQSKQSVFIHQGVSFHRGIRLKSYHGLFFSFNHANLYKMEDNPISLLVEHSIICLSA